MGLVWTCDTSVAIAIAELIDIPFPQGYAEKDRVHQIEYAKYDNP